MHKTISTRLPEFDIFQWRLAWVVSVTFDPLSHGTCAPTSSFQNLISSADESREFKVIEFYS
jgi:hypothetical protein